LHCWNSGHNTWDDGLCKEATNIGEVTRASVRSYRHESGISKTIQVWQD